MGKDTTPHPAAVSSETPPPLPKSYRGRYKRVVDQSHRVLIPSDWRSTPITSFLVVAWPLVGPAEYLAVLPPNQAEKLRLSLDSVPLSDDAGTALARALAHRSYEIQLDDYGRLPIPEAAAQDAGIVDSVYLVGGFSRFELWNPDRFEASISRPENVAQVKQGIQSLRI
jgi:MraZ protein